MHGGDHLVVMSKLNKRQIVRMHCQTGYTHKVRSYIFAPLYNTMYKIIDTCIVWCLNSKIETKKLQIIVIGI